MQKSATSNKKFWVIYRLFRVDKPIGYMLLLWPVLWVLAVHNQLFSLFTPLFISGVIFMRSAGAAISDIFDSEYDARVQRTKTRPIAAGQISKQEALVLFAILVAFAGLITIFLPLKVIAISALFALVTIIYPLMKRITYLPQFVLGLCYNGVIITWLSIEGHGQSLGNANSGMLILYVAVLFWVVGFDTIYAIQDLEYDKKIGVKSTAILYEHDLEWFVTSMYKLFMCTMVIFGMSARLSNNYYIMLILAAIHLLWQAKDLNDKDVALAARKFRSNNFLGFLIFMAIVAGR